MKNKSLVEAFILIFIFNTHLNAQEVQTVDQKLNILQGQIELLKSQVQENSTQDLYKQLDELKKAKAVSNDPTTTSDIQALQSELAVKEKAISELQETITSLTTQISAIAQSVNTQGSEKLKADELAKEAEKIKNDLTVENITRFKAYIFAWKDLGTLLAASGKTGKALLIFPDAKTEPLLESITKYAGIVGGVVGPIMYASAASDDAAAQKKGVITTGVSLSVTGLVSLLFKNKNNKKVLENIGRNVSFNDEVKSFDKLASQFQTKSESLYNSIKTLQDATDWKPTPQNLIDYYGLISLRRDLTVVVRQMKAKSEFLKELSVTDDGKIILDDLILTYGKALESWESSESVYLSTYNYLYQLNSGNTKQNRR